MREAEKLPAVMSSARSPVTTAFVTLRLVAVIAPEMLAPVHVSLPFASTHQAHWLAREPMSMGVSAVRSE